MDPYLQLAESAVNAYIKNKKIIKPPCNLPAEFYCKKAGVFVTIFKNKELRACLGTYLPLQENLALEIIHNAVSACSNDFRFARITEQELPSLSYEVSILTEPQAIRTIKEHNPKIYGLIVKTADGRCGLLLPDLEGIQTSDQQIVIACRKAGIEPSVDPISLYNFTVEKHKG